MGAAGLGDSTQSSKANPTMPAIYALCDPDGVVRYIGKANHPKKRFGQHLREARKGLTPKDEWITSLVRENCTPSMVVLVGDSRDWEADERRLIAEHRAAGAPLLNVADGGIAQYQSKPRPRGAYFKMMHRFQTFINEGATQFVPIRDAYRAQRKAALKKISASEHDAWLNEIFEGRL
jgi:hypothetical protein